MENKFIRSIRIIIVIGIWVSFFFSILPLVIIYSDFDNFVYGLYAFISISLVIYYSNNIYAKKNLEEKLHFNFLFVSTFWYAFLVFLPIFLVYEDRINRKNRLPKPLAEDVYWLKNLLSRVSTNKETLEQAFDSLEELDENEKQSAYDSLVYPVIQTTLSLKSELDQFQKYNYSDVEGIDYILLSQAFDYFSTSIYLEVSWDNSLSIHPPIANFFEDIPPKPLFQGDLRYALSSLTFDNSDKSKWEIYVAPSFKKSFKKISENVKKKAYDCIEKIILNPRKVVPPNIVPLAGDKKGIWRYRFGEYRILYEPDIKSNIITFISISPRQGAYN